MKKYRTQNDEKLMNLYLYKLLLKKTNKHARIIHKIQFHSSSPLKRIKEKTVKRKCSNDTSNEDHQKNKLNKNCSKCPSQNTKTVLLI